MKKYNLNYVNDGYSTSDYTLDKDLFKNLTKNKRSKVLKRLPKIIDHSNEMSKIKDQGTLGSCVAFSTAAVKEWQEIKEYDGKIKDFSDLSEQWIYYNTKKIDNMEGEGTTIRAALKILQKIGVPPEIYWKYNPLEEGLPKKDANDLAKFTRISKYYRLESLKEIKIALSVSPLPLGVIVFNTFYKPKNGIISMPKCRAKPHGGHAICAVGYDDHKKLIKFKNSWNTSWGENGYGYLSYKYIKKYCLAAWIMYDIKVPIEDLNGL